MFKDIPEIDNNTKLKDLIEFWEKTRRAFAVILGERGDYSPVSARKMLEIGKSGALSDMPARRVMYLSG